MRRTLTIVAAISTLFYVYGGWIATSLPENVEEVNQHLDREVLAYEEIDGTPLIIAEYGGTVFLDTLERQLFTKSFPPTPGWKWSGDWERIHTSDAPATGAVSRNFGPLVIYGLVNNDDIMGIQIERDGLVIQQLPVGGLAYIISVEDVRNTDTIVFVGSDGIRVSEQPLTPTARQSAND